jgi:hydrogenase expression/formation protein HypD
MKYLEEFRNKDIVKHLTDDIWQISKEMSPVKFMEVCGTHTMSIARFGLRHLLPKNVELISGPGCPVCVTSNSFLDHAIALSRLPNITITTFGDLMRVPGSTSSLEREKAEGQNIEVVYSTLDALQIAEQNPNEQVIFLGIGFETTVPTIAAAVILAKQKNTKNFSVLCAHKTMPKPMEILASEKNVALDGFICPAHVTAIIGTKAYHFLAEKYHKACAVTGFEPVDIMQGILLLLKQCKNNTKQVDNQYARVATFEGNSEALKIIKEVFRPCDAEWRGIGNIPGSGLMFKSVYKKFDASDRFKVEVEIKRDHPGCICGKVMTGTHRPYDCKLFGSICTPENPVGACMVSSEGTCAAYYKYELQ